MSRRARSRANEDGRDRESARAAALRAAHAVGRTDRCGAGRAPHGVRALGSTSILWPVRLTATRLFVHHLVRGTFRREFPAVLSFGTEAATRAVAARLAAVNVNTATRLCWAMR